MKLNDRYDGSNDPFQGDRVLHLSGLPVGACIQTATAIVTPVSTGEGIEPFVETIRFNDGIGDWGATKTQVRDRWVEVDFHSRRTLARVRGANLQGATLQVDLGGAFVEINENGGIKTPSDPDPFTLENATDEPLPGLSVVKLKLTKAPAEPQVHQVVIRSTPTNVSLRFGEMPAFWTHVGELVQTAPTPDFALALQAFLAEAKAENGSYIVPVVLHSDSIARLQIEFNVEFLVQETGLRGGVGEVVLPFDFSRVADATPEALGLEIPAGSRLVPPASTARVTGSFAETRIVYDPLEKVSAKGLVSAISPEDLKRADKIVVAPDAMQAQPISLAGGLVVSGIDLLLEVRQTTRLQLNFREDLDGKPGATSLLPKPVEFAVPGPVGLEEATFAGRSKWTSVALPAEFRFRAVDDTTQGKRRYWIVLQSLEGEALWSVATGKDAPNLAEVTGMKRSGDGGLSWREAATSKLPGPLVAFFRLRRKPERFTMPIALQVGSGESAVRVGLDRFAATGRVDFALDFNDVSQALEKLPASTASACTEAQHLVNGDFERWMRVGDEARSSASVPVTVSVKNEAPQMSNPLDVAVAPDGAVGYVVSELNEAFHLHVIDVGCSKQAEAFALEAGNANRLVVSPDGERLYVGTGMRIQLVDTRARVALGVPFDIDEAITALAVSPDGGRLFIATREEATSRPRIAWWETAELERAVTGGNPSVTTRGNVDPLPVDATVVGLAATPDGSRLCALIDRGATEAGEVRIFDASALSEIGSRVVVGRPSAISLTADGEHALVTNDADNSVSIIDTATGTVTAQIPLAQPPNVGRHPVSIVASSDGKRAYVANGVAPRGTVTKGTISVIDLSKKRVSKEISLGFSPRRLAITPQGDRVYVVPEASPSAVALATLQIGAPRPEEWSLTSGQVIRACQNDPFHQIAQLQGETLSGDLVPAALSQVTPVKASCDYDFSFQGIATAKDAFAEVFWRSREGGPLNPEPDRLPIEVMRAQPAGASSSTSSGAGSGIFVVAADVAARPALALHRKRLTAPQGSEQAEIRFNIPPGGVAWIDQASLKDTTEAIGNGDFRLRKDGRLAEWTPASATAPGFTVVAVESGVRFQNAGANTVELVQRVAAKAKQPFLLEAQNTASAPALASTSGEARPRLQARWLADDGNPTGAPAIVEIQRAGVGAAIARGTSPTGAKQAEIRLIVPPGAAAELQRVSLRFPQHTLVPITFVADAPGELTVSDWQVSYEEAPPERPPIPPGGLSPPTPPGRSPGETPEESGFCHCCEAEREIADSEALQSEAGRPVLAGHCVTCGSEMIRFGGELPADSPRFLGRSVVAPRPYVIVPRRIVTATTASVAASRAALPPITAIGGIGERLASKLARRRIRTLGDLAAASPERVAEVQGISKSQAAKFIAEAQRLLR